MAPLRFVPTMQPELVEVVPAGTGWLHEIKYDGYRTQLHVDAASVRAYCRNGDRVPVACGSRTTVQSKASCEQ
jgi:ATP-dependent DNA ligase